MAENTRLNDEAMAQATGGVIDGLTQYEYYGTIVKYLNNQTYLVRRTDGVEIEGFYEYRTLLEEGLEVALESLDGGWRIIEIEPAQG